MTEPLEERICVIGAGPAGIAAARALRRRGFTRVRLLEKREDVGGKCRTVQGDHGAMDVGAVYVLPNYPVMTRLAREAGLSLYQAAPFVHVGDRGHRPFGEPAPPMAERAAEFLRLGRELLRHRAVLYKPLGRVNERELSELSVPFSEWVTGHRFDYLHRGAYPLLRSFGFGFEAQRIPAAYVVNAFPLLARKGNLLSLWDPSALRLLQVDGGYGELWRRLAAPLDVRLGACIERVERRDDGVSVIADGERMEFDRLVVACPLTRALEFLDATDGERELMSKIRTFEVWQVAAPVTGLPDAVIVDHNQDYARIGGPMLAFRYRPESDWYYFFGYTRARQDEAQILEDVERTIWDLGGELNGDALVHRWPDYFPHYDTCEVAAGYHAELEALQGRRSTYYVGEILSNIGVEMSVRYSEALMARLPS